MSTYKELEKKSDAELVAHVAEKRQELRKFRFGTAGAGTRDVKAAKTAKKEIARSLTALNARTRTEANKETK